MPQNAATSRTRQAPQRYKGSSSDSGSDGLLSSAPAARGKAVGRGNAAARGRGRGRSKKQPQAPEPPEDDDLVRRPYGGTDIYYGIGKTLRQMGHIFCGADILSGMSTEHIVDRWESAEPGDFHDWHPGAEDLHIQPSIDGDGVVREVRRNPESELAGDGWVHNGDGYCADGSLSHGRDLLSVRSCILAMVEDEMTDGGNAEQVYWGDQGNPDNAIGQTPPLVQYYGRRAKDGKVVKAHTHRLTTKADCEQMMKDARPSPRRKGRGMAQTGENDEWTMVEAADNGPLHFRVQLSLLVQTQPKKRKRASEPAESEEDDHDDDEWFKSKNWIKVRVVLRCPLYINSGGFEVTASPKTAKPVIPALLKSTRSLLLKGASGDLTALNRELDKCIDDLPQSGLDACASDFNKAGAIWACKSTGGAINSTELTQSDDQVPLAPKPPVL